MVDPGTVAGRIKQARLQTAVKRGETISQQRMAELVSGATGQPLWQAQWSSYELGKAEPPLGVIQAAAKLSGLDPAYLAFGGRAEEKPVAPPAPAFNARPMPQPATPAPIVRPLGKKRMRGR